MSDSTKTQGAHPLRKELKRLLDGHGAHAPLAEAVQAMPPQLQGMVPEHLPYSAWQLLEHMRIAQRDILDFSTNADGHYQKLSWPDDYWPKEPAPPNPGAWQAAVDAMEADRDAFEKLLDRTPDGELDAPFPWGEGQTLLHEALLIADHNAYHTGELILLRRLLGAWK